MASPNPRARLNSPDARPALAGRCLAQLHNDRFNRAEAEAWLAGPTPGSGDALGEP